MMQSYTQVYLWYGYEGSRDAGWPKCIRTALTVNGDQWPVLSGVLANQIMNAIEILLTLIVLE